MTLGLGTEVLLGPRIVRVSPLGEGDVREDKEEGFQDASWWDSRPPLNGHRGEGKSEDAGELDFSGLLKKR